MARTYIPNAVDFATHLHKYLTRYQSKLLVGASAQQIEALQSLINCLIAFLVDWNKPPINP